MRLLVCIGILASAELFWIFAVLGRRPLELKIEGPIQAAYSSWRCGRCDPILVCGFFSLGLRPYGYWLLGWQLHVACRCMAWLFALLLILLCSTFFSESPPPEGRGGLDLLVTNR